MRRCGRSTNKKRVEGEVVLTLYQELFEMNLTLCERWPALTPFTERKMRAHEVMLLVRRLNTRPAQNKTAASSVTRRPAGDNWF